MRLGMMDGDAREKRTWTSQGYQLLLDVIDEFPVGYVSRARSLRLPSTPWQSSSGTNQIAAHPSASWKLKAMSTPFVSVHTMSVSGIDQHPTSGFTIVKLYPAASDIHHLW
jgi:hypothetical protein